MSLLKVVKRLMLAASIIFGAQNLRSITQAQVAVLREVLPDQIKEGSDAKQAYSQWIETQQQQLVLPRMAAAEKRVMEAAISDAISKTYSTEAALVESERRLLDQSLNDSNSPAYKALVCKKKMTESGCRIIFPTILQASFSEGLGYTCGASQAGRLAADQAALGFINSQCEKDDVQRSLKEAVSQWFSENGFEKLAGNLAAVQFVAKPASEEDFGAVPALSFQWKTDEFRFGGLSFWEGLIKLAIEPQDINRWIRIIVKNAMFERYTRDKVADFLVEYNANVKQEFKVEPEFLERLRAAKERFDGLKKAREDALAQAHTDEQKRALDATLLPDLQAARDALADLNRQNNERIAQLRSRAEAEKARLGGAQAKVKDTLDLYMESALSDPNSEWSKLLRSVAESMRQAGIKFELNDDGSIKYGPDGFPIPVVGDTVRSLGRGGQVETISIASLNEKPAVFEFGFKAHKLLFQIYLQGLTSQALAKAYSLITGAAGDVQFDPGFDNLLKVFLMAIQGRSLVDASGAKTADPRTGAFLVQMLRLFDVAGFHWDDASGRFLPSARFQARVASLNQHLGRPEVGKSCKACSEAADNESRFKETSGFYQTITTNDIFNRKFAFGQIKLEGDMPAYLGQLKTSFDAIQRDTNGKVLPGSMAAVKAFHDQLKANEKNKPCCFACYLQNPGVGSDAGLPFFTIFERLEGATPVYSYYNYDVIHGMTTGSGDLLSKIEQNPLYLFKVNPILAIAVFLSSGDFTLNSNTCVDHRGTLTKIRVYGRAAIPCLAQPIDVHRGEEAIEQTGPVALEKLPYTPPAFDDLDPETYEDELDFKPAGVDVGDPLGRSLTEIRDVDEEEAEQPAAPADRTPAAAVATGGLGAGEGGTGLSGSVSSDSSGESVEEVVPVGQPAAALVSLGTARPRVVPPLRALPGAIIEMAAPTWSEFDQLQTADLKRMKRLEGLNAAVRTPRVAGTPRQIGMSQLAVATMDVTGMPGYVNPEAFRNMQPDEKIRLISALRERNLGLDEAIVGTLGQSARGRASSDARLAGVQESARLRAAARLAESGRPGTAARATQTSAAVVVPVAPQASSPRPRSPRTVISAAPVYPALPASPVGAGQPQAVSAGSDPLAGFAGFAPIMDLPGVRAASPEAQAAASPSRDVRLPAQRQGSGSPRRSGSGRRSRSGSRREVVPVVVSLDESRSSGLPVLVAPGSGRSRSSTPDLGMVETAGRVSPSADLFAQMPQ